MVSEAPLWRPSAERVAAANLTRFIAAANRRHGLALASYAELQRWSVAEPEAFWCLAWDELGVIAETRGECIVADREKLPGARWFPEARLNFAQNLLRRADDDAAMIFRGEDQVSREVSHAGLTATVSRLQQALAAAGVGPGDRVAAFLPNLPETMMAMLATASLGAVWSSCSPDFGVPGVLDRFGQIAPKVLFVADGYRFNGRHFDTLAKARAIVAGLPTVARVVLVPYTAETPPLDGLGETAARWDDFIAPYEARPLEFRPMPFNAPLYILYSSGTTGKPKCIVHGAGGTLIQHLKEHQLNCDLRPGDRLFYFTTCGWMMWNWLASALASEASLVLYDGSPFHPDGNVLFDLADAARITHFGASAKYLDALAKAGLEPARTHHLGSVRALLSTGSPLSPQGFRYVYEKLKPDLHLASVSGGTDIVSCFVAGDPTGTVWAGEIQALGLGMDVCVFDETGQAVMGRQGELVCRNSFPSMPVGFWNDPDGSRYRDAYFNVYPGVWRHGDWAEITTHGGIVIYGRSDATLNPGGVRIGTAEIYRQVEALEEVQESLVIGQRWDDDVRVVLFVILRPGFGLDEALRARIRRAIRDNASPRHVPAKIVQVADIPRTVNGKITELAVADVVHGRAVKNKEALANPAALELYRDLPELRT
jgi:acetoacetyl-CoA synthetase